MVESNFGALQTTPTTNNVAAGSYGHGWWIDTPIAVNGESAFDNAGYSPANIALKVFEGNVAHLNLFYGLNQTAGYTPVSASVIKVFRSYRIRGGAIHYALLDAATNSSSTDDNTINKYYHYFR